MQLITLHGFLGLPSDWNFFENSLSPSLWEQPILPLKEWAEEFNQKVEGDTLIGYSLGGRLALHALISAPKKWKAAVIISAHPGLKTPQEREQRLQNDQRWSEKFLTEPWGSLIQQWNSQGVLSNTYTPQRKEEQFNRLQLAQALDIWSLGRQQDLRSAIKKLQIPILWLVGEDDTKFTKLTNEIELSHIKSKLKVVPNCGHRLPWQKKQIFFEETNNFFDRIGEKNDLTCTGNMEHG